MSAENNTAVRKSTDEIRAAVAQAKRSYEYLVMAPGISPNAIAVADRWLAVLVINRTFGRATGAVVKNTRWSEEFVERVVKVIGPAVYRSLYGELDTEFETIIERVRQDEVILELTAKSLTAAVAVGEWIDAARDAGPLDRFQRADVLYRIRAKIAKGKNIDPDGDLAKLKTAFFRESRRHRQVRDAARRMRMAAKSSA
jgi:hypothetical protein